MAVQVSSNSVGPAIFIKEFAFVLIFAYIDPGAGSLIIQALIAAVLSVPFFFRRSIASAVRRFRGSDAAGRTSDASAPADADR